MGHSTKGQSGQMEKTNEKNTILPIKA